jgi:molybdate transport system substrate-binding protein
MRKITEAAFVGLKLGFASAGLLAGASASAADIKVLSAIAVKAALDDLIAPFEAETGHKLSVVYGTGGGISVRLQNDEPVDVTILPKPPMDALVQQSKVPAAGLIRLLSSAVGVAVREGASKPDISSPDALKRSLLAAKSIAYGDPSRGGASGIHFVKVLDQLGITDEMKVKTTLFGRAPDLVARGEVEMAVTMVPEILPVSGVTFVGPLPEELQSKTDFVYFGAVVAGAKEIDAGRALLQFLISSKAAAVFRAKGMDPG